MAASQRDIVTWVVQAGFTGTDRVTAVAVALAAGANPAAPNGLFGIGGGGTGASQTAAAYAKFTATGWAGFPSHGNGGWLLYAPLATAAVETWAIGVVAANPKAAGSDVGSAAAKGIPSPGGPGFGPITTPLNEAGAILNFLTQPITWNRISKVVVGFALLAIGAARLTYRGVHKPIGGAVDKTLRNLDEGVARHTGGRRP